MDTYTVWNSLDSQQWHLSYLNSKFKHLEAVLIESEDQILELVHRKEWDYISEVLYLSETIIRKYQNELNWKLLGQHQILSDDLIVEFLDKIDPTTIVSGQQSLNREDMREDVLILIHLKWIEKLNNDAQNEPIKIIGKFTSDAKRLYDYIIAKPYCRPSLKRRIEKLTSIITIEKMCNAIRLYDDRLLDFKYELREDNYLNSATVLRKFCYDITVEG
jgi:hypothetical protein